MYSPLVRDLDSRLLARKVVHVLGGLAAAWLVLVLPVPLALGLAAAVIVAYWAISKRISLALLTLILLLVLTRSRGIAAGSLTVLALGDGAAGILGRAFGRTHWPWRHDKTIEGSLAFWAAATGGLLALLSLLLPGAPPTIRALLAALPALAGCAAEMLPLEITQNAKPDDNLGVMLASGGLLYVLCLMLKVSLAGLA